MKRLFIIMPLLFFVVGCGDNSQTDNQSIIGTWELTNSNKKEHFEFYSDNTFYLELEHYELEHNSEGYGSFEIQGTVETCSGDEAIHIILSFPNAGGDSVSFDYVYIRMDDNLYLQEQSGIVSPLFDVEGEVVLDPYGCNSLSLDQPYIKIIE